MDDAVDTSGLVAGRFRVEGLLGSGGTASVFRAYDTETGRTVALKLLHPHLSQSDLLREAFLVEAQRAARVRHPGIVAVLDIGTFEEHGIPIAWIAQELVDGVTLSERVRVEGPLSSADAAAVACDILDALAAAHATGLVHRDVSPANVLVRLDAAAGRRAARLRRAARKAGMRADDRDQSRDDEAEQRQKDDRLVHRCQPFMRLMSSTAIDPRLR